jgi:predicted transcriptional regulator of viral defense system
MVPIYRDHAYRDTRIYLQKDFPDSVDVNRVRTLLLRSGVLKIDDRGNRAYSLVLAHPPEDTAELACALDPACCASHYSAMVYHGLTDRFPNITVLTTPSKEGWAEFVERRKTRDLGEFCSRYDAGSLPALQRFRLKPTRKATSVSYYQSALTPSYVLMRDGRLRVSSIGRVFLEMLRQPDLCGGMAHIATSFETAGARYADLIIAEVDRFGGPIDKVRAGYFLESIARITDPRIDSWTVFVSRGGSRVLDPSAPYAPEFSKRWSLSINLPGLPT